MPRTEEVIPKILFYLSMKSVLSLNEISKKLEEDKVLSSASYYKTWLRNYPLKKLIEKGLIEEISPQEMGKSRVRHAYRLTSKGFQHWLNQPISSKEIIQDIIKAIAKELNLKISTNFRYLENFHYRYDYLINEKIIIRIERSFEIPAGEFMNMLKEYKDSIDSMSHFSKCLDLLDQNKLILMLSEKINTKYSLIIIFTGKHPKEYEIICEVLNNSSIKRKDDLVMWLRGALHNTLKLLEEIEENPMVEIIFAGEFNNVEQFEDRLRQSINRLL